MIYICTIYTHRFHIQSIIMYVEMYIVHNILIPMQVSVYFWGIGMQHATSNWLSLLELASYTTHKIGLFQGQRCVQNQALTWTIVKFIY